jgi:hypothetical protein
MDAADESARYEVHQACLRMLRMQRGGNRGRLDQGRDQNGAIFLRWLQ